MPIGVTIKDEKQRTPARDDLHHFAREQRARQAAEETLPAIDRMKQAILARAFRGEL